MFDAKIQQIADIFGDKLTDKTDEIKDIFSNWSDQFDGMSRQMKIAIGVSLGLSIADTILLFAILVKLGR